jgi:hypothetical protein
VSLSKSQILAVAPNLKEIEVPEWGGSVWIRPILLGEQGKLADLGTKYEKASAQDRMKNCTLKLISWCVCDEDGQPLFDSSKESIDLNELLKKPASAFLRLQDAILEFSGLTKEGREELEKNLPSRSDEIAS